MAGNARLRPPRARHVIDPHPSELECRAQGHVGESKRMPSAADPAVLMVAVKPQMMHDALTEVPAFEQGGGTADPLGPRPKRNQNPHRRLRGPFGPPHPACSGAPCPTRPPRWDKGITSDPSEMPPLKPCDLDPRRTLAICHRAGRDG